MKHLKSVYAGLDRIITLGGLVAGIFILCATGMIFYEVVSRFLFNAPTIWATELSIYTIIGSCFFGAAYTLRRNGHIRVDLLLHNVSAPIRKGLLMVTCVIGLIFSIVFTVYGWEHVISSKEFGFTSASLLRIPMYIPEMLLPLGGILLCFSFLLQFIDTMNGKEQEEELE
ncbi:TRAP transporter small permease [Brevibacillus sp. B_LB10_24]|uniref:TRAP transporter small permease n=1 Tax=Brevibacillus sp. B_LB10_24 TaxID=3380645 RepID=UPI0038BDE8E1